MENIRFFTAKYMFHENGKETWPKIYVLTPDGDLYSEYFYYRNTAKDLQKVNFKEFKAYNYSYSTYQPLEEVDFKTAITTHLIGQRNWVRDYLKRKGFENL
ncbi:MAG: hypothetical protein KA163_07115 [Bacteroidia bacterium]|nr:hypothetical protein [Bacteroidia bacterium]